MCTSKLSFVLIFVPMAGFVNSLFVIADVSVTVSVSVSSYILSSSTSRVCALSTGFLLYAF